MPKRDRHVGLERDKRRDKQQLRSAVGTDSIENLCGSGRRDGNAGLRRSDVGKRLPESDGLREVNTGIVESGDESICNGGDPANITFSTSPSGGVGTFAYQWYFQDGVAGPCGTPTWATSCRKVTVRNAINYGAVASNDQTICNGATPNVMSVSGVDGSASFAYQWYSQSGVASSCPSGTSTDGWAAISGETSSSYTPSDGITSSTSYACFVTPGGSPPCGTPTWATNCRKVTVRNAINYGAVASNDQTICNGATPNVMSVSGVDGSASFAYQWYSQSGVASSCPSGTSTDGWAAISGETGSSYTPSDGITSSTSYACFVTPGGSPPCGTPTWATNCRKVTVRNAINYGAVASNDQTICNGATPNVMSVSGVDGSASFAYQWYSQSGVASSCPSGTSTDGWAAISGETGSSYTPSDGITSSTSYACFVTPGGSPPCGTPTWATNCRKVTVRNAINYGAVASNDETICNGATPNVMSVSGVDGSASFAYQWYSQSGVASSCPSGTSTDGWAAISGETSSSYTPSDGITSSTSYACFVTPGGSPPCGTPTWATNCRKVTVFSAVNTGIVESSDETFCSGADPSLITFSTAPSGGAGTFAYQWYYQDGLAGSCPSGTGTSDWNAISGATSSSYDPPSGLTASRTYAVQADATGTPDCGVPTWSSGCRKVTVYAVVNTGIVSSGDETICIGGDPANITFSTAPSGGAGTFAYQWYYQDGLAGSCPSGTGTSGWTPISGATGSSYDPPSGLTASRTYAVQADATGTPDCGDATWSSGCRKVTVNVRSTNPTSASASSVSLCNGQSTTLTLNGGSGGTGAVIKWYAETCGGTFVGSNNDLSVSPTATTTYYGRYEDPAPCGDNTSCASVTVTVKPLTANLKVYLEGPWICYGTSMTTWLSDPNYKVIPIKQPYSDAPWTYGGTEQVNPSFFDVQRNITDWILVELRSGNPDAYTYSMITVERRAGFLKGDGNITDIDGSSPLKFSSTPIGDYYVVIWHRNHLAVMSAGTVAFDCGNTATYDFTDNINKAFNPFGSSQPAMTQLQSNSNVYGMIGGNSNGNEAVDSPDFTLWLTVNGLIGYFGGDCNLDTSDDSFDLNTLIGPNFGSPTDIPF